MDSRAGRSCQAMVSRRVSEALTAIPRSRVGLPLNQQALTYWVMMGIFQSAARLIGGNRAKVRKSSAPLSSCVGTSYSSEVNFDCFNACGDWTEREFFYLTQWN